MDRRRRTDGLFSGWDVPGISCKPAVMRHAWQDGALVNRMRNIPEKGGWLSRALKLQKFSFAADAAARKKETLPLSRIVTVKGLQKCMVGVGERQRVILEGELPSYLPFRTGAETYDYKLLSASSPGCPRARGI